MIYDKETNCIIIESIFKFALNGAVELRISELNKLKDAFEKNREHLWRNKILTTLAYILENNDIITDRTRYLVNKWKVYMEESRKISEWFSKNGIEAIIVKTIRSVPCDVSDIDLLINKDSNISIARHVLKKLGYVLRRGGLGQELWSKIVSGYTVNVELHNKLAAADYEYYPREELFGKKYRILNNIKIPDLLDELLINVSHAVMKDLEIKFIELLEFLVVLNKYNIQNEDIINKSRKLGLLIPLFTLALATYNLFNQYSRTVEPLLISLKKALRLNFHIIRILLNDKPKSILDLPISVNPLIILCSYFNSFTKKIVLEGFTKTFREALSIPCGPGIDTILYRWIPIKKPHME